MKNLHANVVGGLVAQKQRLHGFGLLAIMVSGAASSTERGRQRGREDGAVMIVGRPALLARVMSRKGAGGGAPGRSASWRGGARAPTPAWWNRGSLRTAAANARHGSRSRVAVPKFRSGGGVVAEFLLGGSSGARLAHRSSVWSVAGGESYGRSGGASTSVLAEGVARTEWCQLITHVC